MLFDFGLIIAVFVASNFCSYMLWHFYAEHEYAQKIEKALIRTKDLFK